MADPDISAPTSQEGGVVTDPTDDVLSDFFTPKSMPVYLAAQALEYGCETEEEFANRISSDCLSAEEYEALEGLNNANVRWRERARLLQVKIYEDINKAVAAGLPTEMYQRKLDYIKQREDEMERIHRYVIDIDDELAKGESSELRIDKRETEKAGLVNVTIRSLDLWAKSNYGLSSFLPPMPTKGKGETRRTRNEAEQEDGDRSQKESGATKLNNLYVSFALLVEAFVESRIVGTEFRKGDGTPNEKAIAKHLDLLSRKDKDPKLPPMDYQTAEAIRKRMAEARHIKRRILTKG